MSKGRSIHIGLNRVDPAAYGGWDGRLAGCINDARAMQGIADGLLYESTILVDAQATSAAVIRELGRAAADLTDGDILLLTYSGHGGQVPDANGDEPDGQDETWVLYDRQLIDDELCQLWSQFAEGVRIVVLSDSCHSGTMLKVRTAQAVRDAVAGTGGAREAGGGIPRNLPLAVEARDNLAQRALYETVQWLSGAKGTADVRAGVLLLAGCQDNQLSYDGAGNGRFTAELLTTWADGGFTGDYQQFHRAILDRMPPDQSPNYATLGAVSAAFEGQRPFMVAAPGGESQPEQPDPSEDPAPPVDPVQRPTLRRGDSGPDVTDLQELLAAHGYDVVVDGYFGPQVGSMVRAFQYANGLIADGVVGPATWAALGAATPAGDVLGDPEPEPQPEPAPDPEPQPDPEPAPDPEPVAARPTLRQGDRGPDVEDLQTLLREQGFSIVPDGIFGPYTGSVVRQFQRSCGLVVDGIVGEGTWSLLEYQPAFG